MTKTLKIAIAQLNTIVGDIDGNVEKMLNYAKQARDEIHADVIVYPELVVTGYSPEDLLFRQSFIDKASAGLQNFVDSINNIYCLVGHPHLENGKLYNAASLIYNGKILTTYFKQILPNYAVFDEHRYFHSGTKPCLVNIKDVPVAITVCYDVWHEDPIKQAEGVGARLMLTPNASPFEVNKDDRRQKTLGENAALGNIPIVYVNCVGGQDDLLFDGGSMVIDQNGHCAAHADFFKEQLFAVDFTFHKNTVDIATDFKQTPPKSILEKIYQALVLGVKDYVNKNNFPGVLLGLSGGIDSALVLAIAVDALGADRVETVMMPTKHTSQLSLDIANELVQNFQVKHHEISVDDIYHTFLKTLEGNVDPESQNVTAQNIQARARGVILMALSNQHGQLVLTTGNKSEMAVGYATLYGDMVGGFAVLKDVPKTMVYELVNYRNDIQQQFPQAVIDRPPTAELADNQQDQDSLPPYPILDEIIRRYVKKRQKISEIVTAGFKLDDIMHVVNLVKKNEYKRQQSPPGVRIFKQAFGRDRRYPITNKFDDI